MNVKHFVYAGVLGMIFGNCSDDKTPEQNRAPETQGLIMSDSLSEVELLIRQAREELYFDPKDTSDSSSAEYDSLMLSRWSFDSE